MAQRDTTTGRYAYYPSDDDEECASDGGWISWFCNLDGHQFFCEVDDEYVRDNFNLHGLKGRMENYDKALEMIHGHSPDEDDLMETEFLDLYRDATDLYGLIHARYIMCPRGLQQMKEKFINGIFGHCPRVLCDRQHTLPVGMSEDLHAHRVRVYCPKCQEAYELRCGEHHSYIDGAYFGTSFAHMFLQTFTTLLPLDIPKPFVPKVFGFRVYNKKSTIQLKLEAGEYGMSAIPASTCRDSSAEAGNTGGKGEDDSGSSSDIRRKDSNYGGSNSLGSSGRSIEAGAGASQSNSVNSAPGTSHQFMTSSQHSSTLPLTGSHVMEAAQVTTTPLPPPPLTSSDASSSVPAAGMRNAAEDEAAYCVVKEDDDEDVHNHRTSSSTCGDGTADRSSSSSRSNADNNNKNVSIDSYSYKDNMSSISDIASSTTHSRNALVGEVYSACPTTSSHSTRPCDSVMRI